MPIAKEKLTEIQELIQQQKYDAAIQKFEPLLEENPESVAVLLDAGFTYGNVHRYEEALKAYEKVTEIAPSSESGFAGLGFIYRKMGKLKEATENFIKSVRLHRDNAMIHFELAETYLEMDEYRLALNSYRKAIQFGGAETDAEVLHRMTQCYLGLEDTAKVIETGKNTLAKDPSLVSVYYLMGTAYFMDGKKAEAVENLEKYLEKMPEDENARNILEKAKNL